VFSDSSCSFIITSEQFRFQCVATDDFSLAQAGPTEEGAFERTDLRVFEQRDVDDEKRVANLREFHAGCVNFSRDGARLC
jgi:hypothetical protein